MSKIKKVLIGITILLVVVIGGFGYLFLQQQKDITQLEFSSVDMSQVADGEYFGQVETMMIKVKVRVEVNQHTIKDIEIIEHQNGLGSDAENIIRVMRENNTYDVDTVTGATASSQVIKSAVNKALEKGIE